MRSFFLITLIFTQIIQQSVELFNDDSKSESLQDIKTELEILKEKQKKNKEDTKSKEKLNPNLLRVKQILSKFLSTLKRDKRKDKKDARAKRSTKPQWHKWSDWSACSVTCGKGRVIRWRHCRDNCDDLETEMEEMSCQLPECPRKLFGFIKLD